MTEPTPDMLEQALQHAGFSGCPSSFAFLGKGAFHWAYLTQCEDVLLVVRWRKPDARFSPDKAQQRARSEYEAAHHFFTFVNKFCPGACPDLHTYHVGSEMSFTVERYMGEPLTSLLPTLTHQDCYAFGEQAGTFFATLHRQTPPLPGYGHIWLKDDLLQDERRSFPAASSRTGDGAFRRLGRPWQPPT